MSIPLNDNVQILAPKPSDPRNLTETNELYASVAAANLAIPISQRCLRLTVNLVDGEYWYKDGITDNDLILKINITKSDIGLSNVDNTTDLSKPISTAQETINNTKLDKGNFLGTAETLNTKIDSILGDSTVINDVTTSSSVPPTGNIHAIGIGPGTYPNWGGMVIPSNNIGTLQRVDSVYSVSLTPINLPIVNNLNSTSITEAGSANNDRLLNEKIQDLEKSFSTIVTTIGNTEPAGSLSGNNILLLNNYDYKEGIISKIKINCNSNGILKLVILEKTESLYLIIKSENVNCVPGVNTFIKDIDFNNLILNKNQYLAIQTSVNTYYSLTGKGYYYYQGEFLGGELTLQQSGDIRYSFDVITSYTETINSLKYDISNLSLSTLNRESFEISNTELFTHTNSSPIDYTFINATPVLKNGVIKKLQVNGTAGIISILVVNFNPTLGTRTIVSEIEKTIIEGINEIPLDMAVTAGNYIGVYFNTAKVYYLGTGTHSDYSFTGKLVGAPVLSGSREIDFGFTLSEYTSVENNLQNQINNDFNTQNVINLDLEKTIAENETKFIGWNNTNFAIIDNIIQSSTAGASLTSTKRFGVENRIIEIAFIPTNSASKFVISSFPAEQAIYAGSAIRVNLVNNRIEILERYSDTLGNVIHHFIPTFTITANVKYKLQIELNGRVFTLKIAKENTTAGFKMFDDYELLGSITSVPLGYATFPSVWNYNVGTMQGSIRLINENGGVKILSLIHSFKCKKSPLIYLCGDSITEGFSVDDDSKYGGLLQTTFGKTEVCLSGIGGATSTGALLRIQSELLKLNPKYFIPYFGSNGETNEEFTSGMTSIINLAIANKCTVLLCSVPTDVSRNNIITSLALFYGLNIIDFKSILLNQGAVIPELYNNIDANGTPYSDNVHPNPLGHYLMFNEVLKYIE